MRKTAGLLVCAALFMFNAVAYGATWTVGITVQGPAAGMGTGAGFDNVTITTPAKVVQGGTAYVYPDTAQASVVATINNKAGYAPTVTLNGAPANVVAGQVTIPQALGVQSLKVVYGIASIGTLTINQSAGGTVTATVGNATTTTGFTGLAAGTHVAIAANPGYGYKVTSINGVLGTGPLDYVVVAGNQAVGAVFAIAPYINASLSAPVTATTAGFTVNANASTNAGNNTLLYSFKIDAGGFSVPSTTTTATYAPTAGTHTVTVHVTTTADVTVSADQIATINVVSATAAANSQCLGCHNSSTPAVIADYNSGVHPNAYGGAPQSTCATCHTTTPHPKAGCVNCHASALNAGTGFVQDNNGVRAITTEFAKWSHHVTGVTLDDAHCAACHLEGTVVNGEVVVDNTKHLVSATVHLRNADTDADMEWDPAAPNHSTIDNFCMSCHDANGATSTISSQIQAFINANGLAAAGKVASASNPFGDTISNRYDKMQRPAVTNVDSQFNTTNNSHHGVKGRRYTGRTRVAGSRQIAAPATFANNSSATLQGVRSTMYDAGNLNQLYTPLENTGGETAPRTGAATLGDDSTLHCGDCHTVGQWKPSSSETANGSPTPVAIGAHGSNNEYLLRNSLGTDERHTQNAFLQGNITGNILMPAGATPAVVAVGQPIPNGVVVYTNPNGAFLVCYNCHNYNKYGSIFLATGVLGGHAGEYDAVGRCNGIGNTIPFNGYTTGSATDGTQFETRFGGASGTPGNTPTVLLYTSPATYNGEQSADFGNIFGIQCLNCHNSGVGNAYGGIHGSANNTNWSASASATFITGSMVTNPTVAGGAYIDGMGNTTKVERFLPGLGNVQHVPGTLGGVTGGTTVQINTATGPAYTYITGGITNDTNWEQKHWQQQAGTVINNVTGAVTGNVGAGAGCYTLGTTSTNTDNNFQAGLEGPSVTGQGGPATEVVDTWGACDDHNAKRGAANHGFLKKIIRPVTY